MKLECLQLAAGCQDIEPVVIRRFKTDIARRGLDILTTEPGEAVGAEAYSVGD